jgi:hypothetical protein
MHLVLPPLSRCAGPGLDAVQDGEDVVRQLRDEPAADVVLDERYGDLQGRAPWLGSLAIFLANAFERQHEHAASFTDTLRACPARGRGGEHGPGVAR